jgi:hypothetical protein
MSIHKQFCEILNYSIFNMKKLCLFLLFAAISSFLFAQNTSVRQIGFATGLAYKAVKSEAYSSRILSGIGVPVELFYQKINERSRHTVGVGFLSVKPSESYNTSTEDMSGQINYEWLKQAYNWRKINFYYGFTGSASGGYRQYITRKLGNNNEAFEGNLTLNAAIMAEYQQDGKRLTGQINYALIGYQFATLYSFAFTDTRILTPSNVTQISGSLRYLTPVSKHLNIRTGYLFSLYRSPTPQYLGLLQHQFELAVCYQL